MKLLAFDTATESMALAARGPAGRVALVAPGGAAASATLLPQIAALLARAGLAMTDLDAIAFGCGPGGFTGLRTSCAVAQGLGFGLNKPLLPIDSLLIVAEDARAAWPGAHDVVVAMDARMDEVYAARYRLEAGVWRSHTAPALYTLEALPRLWADAAPALLAGSALAAFGARVAWSPAVPQQAAERDRAAALLRLAEAAAAAGAGIEAAQALPIYLRDKVALTTAERAARVPAASVGAARDLGSVT
jgi:tRNA threonylcarbamoyladenosine biosynthesis protein TsaB